MTAARRPSDLQLVSVTTLTNDSLSQATVTVSCNSDLVNGEATSNGVFEAIFQAIDDAVGVRGDRTGLRMNAFADYAPRTNARVRVRFEKREYSGRGASEDPLEAAAVAYLTTVASYLEYGDLQWNEAR